MLFQQASRMNSQTGINYWRWIFHRPRYWLPDALELIFNNCWNGDHKLELWHFYCALQMEIGNVQIKIHEFHDWHRFVIGSVFKRVIIILFPLEMLSNRFGIWFYTKSNGNSIDLCKSHFITSSSNQVKDLDTVYMQYQCMGEKMKATHFYLSR